MAILSTSFPEDYDTPGYQASSFYFIQGTEYAGSNPAILGKV